MGWKVREKMAFIIKKKRYKFQVDLTLNELTEVSFGKAILFAKVRQLDGGNFQQASNREEVVNHAVKYDFRCSFPSKMAANSSTGVLDSCKCRVSIRKEEKGGKNFRKIGFVDLDLAEYAGAGPSTQRYILQAYDQHHRLDNSLLQITLNIVLKEGDLVFQRPLTRTQPILLPGEEASKGPELDAEERVSVISSVPSINVKTNLTLSDITGEDAGHTRNSSNTSSRSQGSGFVSQSSQQSQQAHSRHSSEDSAHLRNPSSGSADTGIYTGSMEKDKRRKKLDGGRVDAEDVINELMEDIQIENMAVQEGKIYINYNKYNYFILY